MPAINKDRTHAGFRKIEKAPPKSEVLSPRQVAVLAEFEKEAGGRDGLVNTLSYGESDPAIEYTVSLIADPRNDDKTLAQICDLGGITLQKLLKHYRDSGGMRAQLKAYEKVWRALPAVAEDVMYRAIPQPIDCAACDGEGKISKPTTGGERGMVECRKCAGTGRTLSVPDLDRQKLALDLGKMLPKGPAVAVNTQVNSQTNNFASASDFRAFRAASDAILFGQAERKTSNILDITPEKSEKSENV